MKSASPILYSITAVLLGGLCGISSCTSSGMQNPLKQTFGNLIQPVFPQNPGELARQATDPTVDPDKRRDAISQLSSAKWGGGKPYLHLYRAFSTDPDDTVRATCLRALGRHGTTEDVPLITKHLQRQAAFERWEAAVALQRIHNTTAIQPLITTARHDRDIDVRIAAIKALGQYAQSSVFDALIGTLNDRDFGAAHHARQSLETITGQKFGLDARAWLAWSKQNQDTLFADRQPYVWQPYNKPPGFWDKAQFWKKKDKLIGPQSPTGLD
ncbi:MAG: hypothetical protein CMJ20_10500 [Phycisphaeraceae bacterium]|nr:hypothetical protein [Phycisphaeraceae bacterium]